MGTERRGGSPPAGTTRGGLVGVKLATATVWDRLLASPRPSFSPPSSPFALFPLHLHSPLYSSPSTGSGKTSPWTGASSLHHVRCPPSTRFHPRGEACCVAPPITTTELLWQHSRRPVTALLIGAAVHRNPTSSIVTRARQWGRSQPRQSPPIQDPARLHRMSAVLAAPLAPPTSEQESSPASNYPTLTPSNHTPGHSDRTATTITSRTSSPNAPVVLSEGAAKRKVMPDGKRSPNA